MYFVNEEYEELSSGATLQQRNPLVTSVWYMLLLNEDPVYEYAIQK